MAGIQKIFLMGAIRRGIKSLAVSESSAGHKIRRVLFCQDGSHLFVRPGIGAADPSLWIYPFGLFLFKHVNTQK